MKFKVISHLKRGISSTKSMPAYLSTEIEANNKYEAMETIDRKLGNNYNQVDITPA